MPRKAAPKPPPPPPPDLGVALEKLREWRSKYQQPRKVIHPGSGLMPVDVDVIIETVEKWIEVNKLVDI